MRTYFLRLAAADFSKTGSTWTSPVIDLYANSSYTNYSTVKSSYGTNLLGNGVWTGLLNEDRGYVSGGRYVDLSGQINLISFTLDVVGITPTLDIYTADAATAPYPDEWAVIGGLTQADEIGIFDADRYARFVLRFTTLGNIAYSADLIVRVEIDTPLMAPMYSETRRLLDKFPKWMSIREIEGEDPATPSLATPVSLGGKLLNAISGEWLDEIGRDINYLNLQRFIDTVDLTQRAWLYKTEGCPSQPWSIVGDGIEVGRAISLEELYDAIDGEHVCWFDEETQTLYSNLSYSTLTINGSTHVQVSHHVWNWVDEIGLLVDLKRLELESNESYRHRILDVYRSGLGSGLEAFKKALRRELNIWQVYGATPSSDYFGATPEVLEMSDIEGGSLYVTPEGIPTDRFVNLIDYLSRSYPTTWGRFRWDNALWAADYEGYGMLPYRLDATPLSVDYLQSGVGDGNDLFVYHPDTVTGPHSFNARLIVRGRHRTTQTQYPPVEFDVTVWGSADKTFYTNPSTTVFLSLEAQTTGPGNPTYVTSFELTATSDVDLSMATPSSSSNAHLSVFEADDATNYDLVWVDKATNDLRFDRIGAAEILSLKLVNGQWNKQSGGYINRTTSDTFAAWFSTNPTTVLTYNSDIGATPTIPTLVGDEEDAFVLPRAGVSLSSKQTAATVGRWESDKYTFHVAINDVQPATATDPVTIPMPAIVWDNELQPTPNKQWFVRVETTDGNATPVYGAWTYSADGNQMFLGTSYLRVNGQSFTNNLLTLGAAPSDLTFTVTNGVLYPVAGYTWQFYEARQLQPITGMVDENGPWRNGVASNPDNTNYALLNATVTRASFGIPETEEYVLTWMGVETENDPQVITWVDTNAVRPAVDAPFVSDVTYPENTIQETHANNLYAFTPFTVRARLNPAPTPQWNPQVHSGWFFEKDKEYYFYAQPVTEVTSSATPILKGVARQGAPIIIKTNEATPKEYRQVMFFSEASPTGLTLTHQETMDGTGITSLYLSYPNVYSAAVTDLTTNSAVALVANSSATNVLTTTLPTDTTHQYVVSYRVRNSFAIDNLYEDTATPGLYTRVFFDATPSTPVSITYENSPLNPATPVPVNLSPLYSSMEEGFIFISHDEYTLNKIELRVSPVKILADGQDYLIITVRSFDQYGNPKPKQQLNLTTTFGSLDKTQITTDVDGFAVAMLTATYSSTPPTTGVLTVSGAASTQIEFGISPLKPREARLLAAPNAEQIPADGRSQLVVYGQVQDPFFVGIPHATVTWRRGRSLYEAFGATPNPSATPVTGGTVVTNNEGRFVIGPIVAATPDEAGYWYLVAEAMATSSTPAGDVVYWHEYPDALHGVENMSGLPRPAIQMATPAPAPLPYTNIPLFPTSIDEDEDATPTQPGPVQEDQVAADQYRAAVLGLKPVLYWRFNDTVGSTTITDATGALNGTRVGTITFQTPGLILGSDKAAVFGGGYAVVTNPALTGPSMPFAIDFWMKTAATGVRYLVDQYKSANDYFSVYINAGGYLTVVAKRGTSTATMTSTVRVNDNKLHYIVIARETYYAKYSLYIDNSLQATATQTIPDLSGVTTYVGADHNGGQAYSGAIDEFAFYSLNTTSYTRYLVGTDNIHYPIGTQGLNWKPPKWFSLPQFIQYNLGVTNSTTRGI